MKLIIYSDLHLEFGEPFSLPPETDADVLVLAGDIIVFPHYEPLAAVLNSWNKPVLYVSGNHEYYKSAPILEAEAHFSTWLSSHYPQSHFLRNEAVIIEDTHFFGGTMWTDFNGSDPLSMETARHQMNDFRLIEWQDGQRLKPQYTVTMHQAFVRRLKAWFEQPLDGNRVVITHHAPIINPNTQYKESPLQPAFNSLDMLKMMEDYQPRLWIYGH
ncbi:MAG: metallophosphoesterase, partial [Rickettsiales bacterium]|nr:metallophosphoesterase [Rickettsiales bacterium]